MPLKGLPDLQKQLPREIFPQGQHMETETTAIQGNQTPVQQKSFAVIYTWHRSYRHDGAIESCITVS